MFGRILLGLAAILLVIALVKWFVRSSPATVKRFLLSMGLVLIVAGLGYLAATGRLHWLYALGAALIPLVRRLFPLLRYVPLLQRAGPRRWKAVSCA